MNLLERRIKRTSAWLITVAIVNGCLGAVQAKAVKEPKTEICHFDTDEGIFKKISVSGNAVQVHLDNHGDLLPGVDNGEGEIILDEDCNEVMEQSVVLARAYIDKNRDGAYDPFDDVEIAELLDSDGVQGLSLGDTIKLGQYPTLFDPCQAPPSMDSCAAIGNFAPTILEVGNVGFPVPGSISVQSLSGTRYIWTDQTLQEGEKFLVLGQDMTIIAQFIDNALFDSTTSSDIINVFSTTVEPFPTETIDLEIFQSFPGIPDYFINVEFPLE